MNKKKPIYQYIFEQSIWVLGGLLAMGTLLDALGNAIGFVSLPVAVGITVFGLLVWVGLQIYLKWRPLPRVFEGQQTKITKLGLVPTLGLVGAISMLQLVHRHPDLGERMIALAKHLGRQFQAGVVSTTGSEEIGQLLETGWHPQFDVTLDQGDNKSYEDYNDDELYAVN